MKIFGECFAEISVEELYQVINVNRRIRLIYITFTERTSFQRCSKKRYHKANEQYQQR